MKDLNESQLAQPQGSNRHYIAGTFWLVIGVISLIAGVKTSVPLVFVGIAAIAYSIYLYRGGRYVMFIW